MAKTRETLQATFKAMQDAKLNHLVFTHKNDSKLYFVENPTSQKIDEISRLLQCSCCKKNITLSFKNISNDQIKTILTSAKNCSTDLILNFYMNNDANILINFSDELTNCPARITLNYLHNNKVLVSDVALLRGILEKHLSLFIHGITDSKIEFYRRRNDLLERYPASKDSILQRCASMENEDKILYNQEGETHIIWLKSKKISLFSPNLPNSSDKKSNAETFLSTIEFESKQPVEFNLQHMGWSLTTKEAERIQKQHLYFFHLLASARRNALEAKSSSSRDYAKTTSVKEARR